MLHVRSVLRALVMVCLAVAFSFGASQLSGAVFACDNPASGEIGTCPPYTDQTCDQDCKTIYGTFGDCSPGGCCVCAI